MQRILIKGKSNDDIAHIARLAERLGLTIQYLDDEMVYAVAEPHTAIAPELTQEQRKGLLDAIDEADSGQLEDMDDVIHEFRKKYE